MKDGVKGACLSRNHFTASCPLSLFYFYQNHLKTKHIHTTHWNHPVVLTFSLCNDVTIVRICKRVHAQRSYLFPELLNHRPETPLCEIQTDLKSVSIPCSSLHLCSCLRSKQGRFFSQGFGLAGRLVPPIGSHGAVTLESVLRHKITHQIAAC